MPTLRADCLAALVGLALLVAALSAAGGAAVADSRADQPAVAATGGAAPVAPHAPVEATLDAGTGAATARNLTVTNVSVWTAPRDAADRLTNRSAIRDARQDGRLTRDATVAMNDTLVFRLRAPGLADRLARAEGTTLTDRFLAATARGNGTFMLQHLNPTVERPSMAARPNGTANTTVVAAGDDTYYVVTRPNSLAYGYCPAGGCESDADADWEPNATGFAPAEENVGPEDAFAVVTVFGGDRRVFGQSCATPQDPLLEYVAADATVRNDRHGEPVPWPEDGRVRVESSLAAGTEHIVRLTNRSDGGPSRSATTVLRDGGESSNGSVAFPGVKLADDATFTVEVIAHGRVIERTNGLAGAEPTPTASATPGSSDEGCSTPTPEPTDGPTATGTESGPSTSAPSPSSVRETTADTGPGFGIASGALAVLVFALVAHARRR